MAQTAFFKATSIKILYHQQDFYIILYDSTDLELDDEENICSEQYFENV